MKIKLRKILQALRPVDPKTRAALNQRWAELPDRVKTPGQTLGKVGVGCEGNHGVFPKCNFACSPCYHSSEANEVRIDGPHTVENVRQQMEYLHKVRAPFAHAQLIGGEVSLLNPEDHAKAIQVMRSYGREPMSFTHGDFDYEYLEAFALDQNGKRRFKRISFAAHFDTTMVGRRGQRRAKDEESIDPYRKAFCDMFKRLKKEHNVSYFLAHNMTITPSNVDEIPGVIRRCKKYGFNLFSFQPAAHIGDDRRWKEDYRRLDPDYIWGKIEEGAGTNLPYHLFEVGDTRCNRSCWGFFIGEKYCPVLDPDDEFDLKVRHAFLNDLGGVHFNENIFLLIIHLTIIGLTKPRLFPMAVKWLFRTIRRFGGLFAIVKNGLYPVTFVMHRFMHAEDVKVAWQLLKEGTTSDNEYIREVQERLSACSYAMAHPESNEIVPACVQHSVLDPEENHELSILLPIPKKKSLA